MDKNSTKKASILIWSVFLLLFLSTSFIYISTKIGKYMDNSEGLVNSTDIKYDFENSGFGSGNDEVYTFLPDNSYTGNLRQNETSEYRFTGSASTNANLVLINSAGLISYKLLLVNSTFTVGTISASGITSTGFTNLSIPLTAGNPTAILYFKNIGGLVNYSISSSSSFQAKKRGYIITKEIGGKTYTKGIGEITNFSNGYLTGTFDLAKYQTYGLYNN
ncbi:MAG: hypothetical protein PHG82_02620 [Candidatus Gracilibacteria bacterium]|nr:hypothetical protein [Candidatus Gracilibacteria bacterium]